MHSAQLFFLELLATFETLTGIAEQFNARTLADLMHFQNALWTGESFQLDRDDHETHIVAVLSQLPSDSIWLSYLNRAAQPQLTVKPVGQVCVVDVIDAQQFSVRFLAEHDVAVGTVLYTQAQVDLVLRSFASQKDSECLVKYWNDYYRESTEMTHIMDIEDQRLSNGNLYVTIVDKFGGNADYLSLTAEITSVRLLRTKTYRACKFTLMIPI